MKLRSDTAVTRVSYEGITNYDSLADFIKTSIEYLSRSCEETISAIMEYLNAAISAGTEVHGPNVGSTSSIT